MRYWLWHIEFIKSISSYPLQTLIIAILTFTLSAAACLILARTPIAQALIGFKKR